jgi:hypothetical protein
MNAAISAIKFLLAMQVGMVIGVLIGFSIVEMFR